MHTSTFANTMLLLTTFSALAYTNPIPEPEAEVSDLVARASLWSFKIYSDGTCGSKTPVYTLSGSQKVGCTNLTPAQQGSSVLFQASASNTGAAFYTGAGCTGTGIVAAYNSGCKQAQNNGVQAKYLSYLVFASTNS